MPYAATSLAPVPQAFLAPAPALPTNLSYVPQVATEGVAMIVPQPAKLTENIPDPTAIESQKAAYSKGLDEQLRQGASILNQQLKQQMDQLHQLADEQKKKYFVQVDHEIKSQELGLVQQFKEQLLMVQQAASQQKRILGQQATALMLEYHQRKTQEDFLMEEYQINKAAYDAQARYSQEVQLLTQQQSVATSAALSQQQAVEQHAAAAMAQIEEQRNQVRQQMVAQSKLVQSAENTCSAMFARNGPPSYVPPTMQCAASPMPAMRGQAASSLSYSPTPVTGTMTPIPMAPTLSYSPTPVTTYSPAPVTQLPTLSYTPAPVTTTFAAAAPATMFGASRG
jgi:hypothetical protein